MEQIREPSKALASILVVVLFGVFMVENAGHAAVPSAPTISVSTNGTIVTVAWSSVPDANGYIFYYAPYPDVSYIGDIDVGNVTGPFVLDLPPGAAFYVAVQAYNIEGNSDFSNITYFVIPKNGDGDSPACPPSGEWSASTEFGEFDFSVNSEGTGITEISVNFSGFKCGPVTRSGGFTVKRIGSSWPITDGAFNIILDDSPGYEITISGEFDGSCTGVSGTWEVDSMGTICSGLWDFP